jgi:ectoine hydroxylase-related dioxygenase (phytanoyl-CoA dioxygenase family)
VICEHSSAKPTDDWYSVISTESHLPPDATRQLRERGFAVVPGPTTPGGLERLAAAYDHAVATADPDDVRVSSSTRVTDLVNRGPEFDAIYLHPSLLAACCLIIGRPFKLSGTRARTLEPGAPIEALHVDVKYRANGWPIVGFIMMVDAFDTDNGATRFVPGSHLQPREPGELLENLTAAHEEQALACGMAGSMMIFNGSVWHGHTANRSARRRRSIQGHFVPREARASVDHAARVRPEVLQRIGSRAKYVLGIE